MTCIDMKCNWWLHATKLSGSTFFRIKKYIEGHTCSSDVLQKEHRQASSWLIGQCIKSKFEEADRVYRPNEIKQDMKLEFGINISYDKAWRARESALNSIRGSHEGSYATLPLYCAMLEMKNPSIVTHIEIDGTNHFKYFF